MSVSDIFSKRKAVAVGRVPELQAETLPPKFRVQVSRVLMSAIRPWSRDDGYSMQLAISGNAAWSLIHRTVTAELGRFRLSQEYDATPADECIHFVLQAPTDEALDLIEVALRYIDVCVRRFRRDQFFEVGLADGAVDAVADFNIRCRENGVGYQFEDGRIVPAGSEYVHDEIVRPALELLRDERFRGPEEEFSEALAKLRRGDHKGAIVEAGKAFESAMKTVCTLRGWRYEKDKATAQELIKVLFEKGLIPPYLQTHFAGLRSVLEAGLPTVRNKRGGHGQGPDPVEVPRALAEYAIHLAATNIVFLVRLM